MEGGGRYCRCLLDINARPIFAMRCRKLYLVCVCMRVCAHMSVLVCLSVSDICVWLRIVWMFVCEWQLCICLFYMYVCECSFVYVSVCVFVCLFVFHLYLNLMNIEKKNIYFHFDNDKYIFLSKLTPKID